MIGSGARAVVASVSQAGIPKNQDGPRVLVPGSATVVKPESFNFFY